MYDESDVVVVRGRNNTVRYVNPVNTYFIVDYDNNKKITGNGLEDTGWEDIPDGIVKVSYNLSTGTVVEIPTIFTEYLHLVEVSQSVLTQEKVFHFVYILGRDYKDNIISYRISLKDDPYNHLSIGDVYVSKEEKPVRSNYWKKAKLIG